MSLADADKQTQRQRGSIHRIDATEQAMDTPDALKVLVDMRHDDDLVVTTMSGTREWLKLSDHPLDFHHIPSTMSGTTPLAIGLALAQPERNVTVVTGDGSLLMNLGCLVTAVASGAKNLTVVLVDNGVYEITGGQKTAATDADVDFAGLARAAGFPNVSHFWDIEDWRERAAGVLQRSGPRFIWLAVKPQREDYLLNLPCPMTEQIERFLKRLHG